MPFDLLFRIVSEAIPVKVFAIAVNAMAIVQSNLTANQSDPSPIELADRSQRRLFWVSVGFGIVAAIIGAFLAWLLWRANNTYQDAVKKDADARIVTADARAIEANAEAAKANAGLKGAEARIEEARAETAKASEEVARLTKEAEALRADAEKARASIATAQSAAAQAKERTEKLAVEAAKARKRQAEAELRLEALRERQEPRWLLWGKFVAELKGRPTGAAEILYQPNDAEAYNLATEIQMALSFAGWQVSSPRPISPTDASTVLRGAPESLLQAIPPTQRVGGQPLGVSIMANDLSTLGPPDPETPSALNALAKAFRAALHGLGAGRDEGLPDNVFRIVVGAKP